MQELSNRTSNDPRSCGYCVEHMIVFMLTEYDRSVEMDDHGATVELQALEQNERSGWSRACEIKNHDDDAIDRLFRAANRYSYHARAYRGMLFPRSDTKYITARRTTWSDRTLELETWVIKVPKDNWPVSKGDLRPEDLFRKISVYRPELQVNYAYEGGISGPCIEARKAELEIWKYLWIFTRAIWHPVRFVAHEERRRRISTRTPETHGFKSEDGVSSPPAWVRSRHTLNCALRIFLSCFFDPSRPRLRDLSRKNFPFEKD